MRGRDHSIRGLGSALRLALGVLAGLSAGGCPRQVHLGEELRGTSADGLTLGVASIDQDIISEGRSLLNGFPRSTSFILDRANGAAQQLGDDEQIMGISADGGTVLINNSNADLRLLDRATDERFSIPWWRLRDVHGDDVSPPYDDGFSRRIALAGDGGHVLLVLYVGRGEDGEALSAAYVFDRASDEFERVDMAGDGAAADAADVREAFISADGNRIAFDSISGNLAPGGAGERRVFLRDRAAGTTQLISVNSAGEPASGSQRYSDPSSYCDGISGDGGTVLFSSNATNMSEFNRGSGSDGLFVRQVDAGITLLVNQDAGGAVVQSIDRSISHAGTLIAISTTAAYSDPYAARLLIRDIGAVTPAEIDLGPSPPGHLTPLHFTRDGQTLLFSSDAGGSPYSVLGGQGVPRVFALDRATGGLSSITFP